MKLKYFFLVLLAQLISISAMAVIIDGIYYDIDTSAKTAAVRQKPSYYSGNIVIPSTIVYTETEYSVTAIGNDAFLNCRALTSVTIPESVTTIWDTAFYGCKGLTSVTIPESVTSIKDYAFSNCGNLSSVTINSNTIASKNYNSSSTFATIFGSQVKEYVLGSDVKGIGQYAFSGCWGLTSITIPQSVTTIGDYAFWGCSGLTSVNIPVSDYASFCNNQIVRRIGNSIVLLDKEGVEIKEYVIPDGVTSIGEGAFSGCSGLTSVTIPESVTTIGRNAFYGCTGLTSITIPESVTSIEDYAFAYCSALTSVTIPESVTSIEDYAFAYCSALTSVTIPESVTTIGRNAFYGCTGLTSVTIPESVTTIRDNTFSGCSSLTSITIPEGVTSIERYAFSGCSGLTSVTIPESVTTIWDNAFSGCSNLSSVTINSNTIASMNYNSSSTFARIFGTQVKEYVFGNDVKSIGQYALSGCSGLTSIYIPNSVTSIGEGAFDGTSWYDNQPDGLVYAGMNAYRYKGTMPDDTTIDIKEGTSSIAPHAFSGCSSLTTITIPNSVITIGGSAFYGCSNLTSVTIPNSVTDIGDFAFYNCGAIKTISIPTSVINIGKSAFDYCDSLTYVYIPESVKSIGEHAFLGSWNLISVTINSHDIVSKTYGSKSSLCSIFGSQVKEYILGNQVTSIGAFAFQGCSSLTSITIPESVTSIGSNAFQGCSSLTSITIPNSVTRIGEQAFHDCNKLTSVLCLCETVQYNFDSSNPITEVVFGEGVKTIGDNIFNGSSQIKTIELGSTITSIGERAFSGSDKLTDVYCKAETPPQADRTAFENSYIDYVTLHVPAASIESYKKTAPWKNFKEIVALSEIEYTITYFVDGAIYKEVKYPENRKVTPEANPIKEGYTFSGWSEIPETMPAKDVTVTGTFSVNSYKVTFKYGDEVLTTEEVEFGAVIPLPESLNSDRYTLVKWLDVPETMPARDIIIQADYVDGVKTPKSAGSDTDFYQLNGVKNSQLKRGLNIIHTKDNKTQKVAIK